MHRFLFFEGTPYAISSFGFMVGIGLIVGAIINDRRRARANLDHGSIQDVLIWCILCGVVGARLLFVVLDYQHFVAEPRQILNFREGGLSWYGSVLGGVLGIWLYCRRQKVSFAAVLDIFAPSLLAAQSIGRVGCLMNGCCYGKMSNLPWAVRLTDTGNHIIGAVPRHPVQIYESLMDLVVLALLLFLERRFNLKGGRVFALYLALYGVVRFIAEFFREGDVLWAGLTLAQLASLLIAAISLSIVVLPQRPIAPPVLES